MKPIAIEITSRYKRYDDVKHREFVIERGRRCSGFSTIYRFDNDFGAVVEQYNDSLGGNDELFQVRIIRWTALGGCFVYITGECRQDCRWGYLTEADVSKLLDRIQEGEFYQNRN